MGIERKSDTRKMRERFNNMSERLEDKCFDAMSRVGEKAVRYARTIPKELGYEDDTGNLRSSTGYSIYHDGELKTSNYKRATSGTTDGSEGIRIGKALSDEVASGYPKGWLLVVTAGMWYAVNLEKEYGRDVLQSTEQMVFQEMPQYIKAIENWVKKTK